MLEERLNEHAEMQADLMRRVGLTPLQVFHPERVGPQSIAQHYDCIGHADLLVPISPRVTEIISLFLCRALQLLRGHMNQSLLPVAQNPA
jgi:hypothetical protein